MLDKIVERTVLEGIVCKLQRNGKIVVFTNGCFDILHIGHLRLLESARSYGDCLVVGVNTDNSVRQLKGPDRPYVPEFERAEMLSGFECVDYLTFFDDLTPSELILHLKPDIHVKGGDYTIEQLPEARIVYGYGGRVIILPLVEDRSTTRLVSQVRKMPIPEDW